jgi:outer membrane protein assembly factor BamB
MNMKINRLAFVLTASCAAMGVSLLFGQWTQWRGMDRNGVNRYEHGLLQEWPKEGPKLLWQIKDAGSGYSTPANHCGALVLLGNNGTDDEFVAAFSAGSGRKLWSATIGKVGNPDQHPAYPGARSTPTLNMPLIYALGSDGDLVCLEYAATSGKVIWKKNLRTDFGGKPGIWAYAESPLIDGDALICTPGGDDATMIALDKKTGEVIWKCAVPGGDQAAYSSIVVSEAAGVKQYVTFLQHGLVGIDAKTGKFLWRYKKTAEGSPANIPTPLVDGDYIYSATGKGGGGLIKIVRDDSQKGSDALKVEEVYFSAKLPTAIGGVVKIGDYLYGTNSQALMCVKFLTGEVIWSERGIGAASILYADGRLYLHGENGKVTLVEASPKAYKELGRFTPPDAPDHGSGPKAWAYPVVSNGWLFIRDANMLWCYDVKASKSAQ